MFAAQFANAAGARVILMSSSNEKLQRAYGLLPGQNPRDGINYRNVPEWDAEVLRLTEGHGADHIMELGGPGTLARSYRALAFGGRIALIGFRPDSTGDCNPTALMMKDGHIDGVLSERDVVRGLSHHGDQFLRLRAHDVATRAPATCRLDDDITSVMVRMTQSRQRHLPVLDADDHLAGLVSIGDIVKNRLDDLELRTNVLRDAYLAHR